ERASLPGSYRDPPNGAGGHDRPTSDYEQLELCVQGAPQLIAHLCHQTVQTAVEESNGAGRPCALKKVVGRFGPPRAVEDAPAGAAVPRHPPLPGGVVRRKGPIGIGATRVALGDIGKAQTFRRKTHVRDADVLDGPPIGPHAIVVREALPDVERKRTSRWSRR